MYAHSMQSASNDCGLASIQTVLKQLKIKFGDVLNLSTLNNESEQQGLSVMNVQTVMESYGVYTEAYQVGDIDSLKTQQLPMILMCTRAGIPHYIVLHQIEDSRFLVSDPAQPQVVEKTKENLLQDFMGFYQVFTRMPQPQHLQKHC